MREGGSSSPMLKFVLILEGYLVSQLFAHYMMIVFEFQRASQVALDDVVEFHATRKREKESEIATESLLKPAPFEGVERTMSLLVT